MRILRVSHWLYPDEIGGGGYHVHAMSRDQATQGHDVTVLKIATDIEQVRREERHGYEIVYCPATIDVLKNDISFAAARKLFDADDFDVIHAHSHFYFSTNLAALKRRLGETPLAITNHSLYSQSAPERLFSYYLRTVGRWTLDSADIIFCYTEEERQKTHELGVSSETAVIANGIDEQQFHPDGPESEYMALDAPSVLFVGRLVEGKNPQDAIETIATVRDEHPAATLYLVGDGPMRAELQSMVRERNLSDAVEFLGQLEYDEMPPLFRSADVLLLPSRAEGFPRVVMEAMAAETPVVCTALDQVETAVDGAGYTVPIGDTQQMATNISQLLADPKLRAECGSQGRCTVEERFAWSDTVSQTTTSLSKLTKDLPQ
ncbi:glycosyltransferase family 4 protein [Halovenus salina]|uniref:Glycosyltransferase family 4 protein n=1 Tax=Halovenus salina TaxID=1510225 RepID=A0ABD5W351_9EURY|nr:glycosyltransferase family 4 protein [Halovenus salina]